MNEVVKSIVTWTLGGAFVLVMFPLSFLLWIITLPTGKSQDIMHWWVTIQGIVLITVFPFWKIEITGNLQRDKGASVIIANHQSLMDIPLMHLMRGNFRWISKIENFKVPVMGLTMRMAGYIPLERGNAESVARMMIRAEDMLTRGISVMIFPEGTRSLTGEVGMFKAGAFRLAVNTGCPLIPVIIDGTFSVLPKRGIILSSGHYVRMKILEPVDPSLFQNHSPEELAACCEKITREELDRMRLNRSK